MASSPEIFLINSFRCQDSKRDHFRKKLMRHFLTGSLSMADGLQKWSPFSTHPWIHPLCNVTVQLLLSILNLGQPGNLFWPTGWSRGDTASFPGLILEACVLLYSPTCSSTFAMRACPGEPAGWKSSNTAESAQLLQLMLRYMMREQKQDRQILLVDQQLTSPDHQNHPAIWQVCEQKHVLLYVTKMLC